MILSWFDYLLLSVAAAGVIYIMSWIASRAFFDNKAEYNKWLLRQLKESDDAEEKRKS